MVYTTKVQPSSACMPSHAFKLGQLYPLSPEPPGNPCEARWKKRGMHSVCELVGVGNMLADACLHLQSGVSASKHAARNDCHSAALALD